MDSTKRFSDRVDDYVKYRPHYPNELIEYFEDKIGLTPEWKIADIGSGTGILAELFLRNGNTVYGIEPNKEMREAGEKILKEFSNYISVDGTAETTGLENSSVDLVTAGQAFHWFNPTESKKEFIRILRPGGWAALIWNSRKKESTPFSSDYEKLLMDFGTDYKNVDHHNINPEIIKDFLGKLEKKVFPNVQELDLEGLQGRLMSSSYIPARGHPLHSQIMKRADEIFKQHEQNGKVRIEYDTEIYFGKLT